MNAPGIDRRPTVRFSPATRRHVLVTLLMGLLAGVGALLHVRYPSLLARICQEDAFVESTTVVLYLAAAALFLAANRMYNMRNAWFWLFALLFFAIAGEEISWGQRIVGLGTPTGLAEINVQEETNLHNIEGIHGSVRALALLVVCGICFVIPLARRAFNSIGRFCDKLQMPIFPLGASGMVVIAILLMAVPRVVFGAIVFELDELGELILAVAFFVFGLDVARGSRQRVSHTSVSRVVPAP